MEIKRDAYLEQLKIRKDNGMITKKPWKNEEGFVIMGMKYFLLNADSLEF